MQLGACAEAKLGLFPYMALLYQARAEPWANGLRHYCGGSLIAPRVVMTAGKLGRRGAWALGSICALPATVWVVSVRTD